MQCLEYGRWISDALPNGRADGTRTWLVEEVGGRSHEGEA